MQRVPLGLQKVVGETSVAAGRSFVRAGMRLLLFPHRAEKITVPGLTDAHGASVDIVGDLVEYTGLERAQVLALIQRKHDNFRAEWHAFPPAVRNEAWFYLASRTYLFANAVHETADVVGALTALLSEPSDILDFGGGTGNLALALASAGHRVDFLERSALQKDFVRFRVQKHGLEGRVRVVDHWTPLELDAYDAICAIDVLEHVETLAETLASMLAAIRPSGLLAEDSPFVRNIENPMHHEGEAGFVRFMHEEGFVCADEAQRLRVWARTQSAR